MTTKRIELRAGDAVWGTLSEDQNGVKTLDLASELTESQVDSYTGGLAPYGSDGEPLQIQQGAEYVYLNDRRGNTQLRLSIDNNNEIVDVQHPLVTLLIFVSNPGSAGSIAIKPRTLLFGFRWK
jgi:hypothetical protein